MKDLWALAKPGITGMVMFTALAGFLLASGPIRISTLLGTLLGVGLLSAGACCLNMVQERKADGRMARTRNRPVPSGRIRPGRAAAFGFLLVVFGFLALHRLANPAAAFLGALAVGLYLLLYTPLKPVHPACTVFGAAAGALPPAIGFTAASGRWEPAAAVLFAILFFWQFPHLLAIAWKYREEYAAAGFRMLPSNDPNGIRAAGWALAAALWMSAAALLAGSFVGLDRIRSTYGPGALLLSAGFAGCCLIFLARRTPASARTLFVGSVLYLPALFSWMILHRLG